ncbi:SRBD1 [Cordylochernes scorpioides]|uniref:SRBD1 n=1 Tax=Cordylochernes scorpioides TaxID=51811 RepID=A0ABY6K122_9ARAC|nr:SRBD1 [Cordylochernes scorpioides]
MFQRAANNYYQDDEEEEEELGDSPIGGDDSDWSGAESKKAKSRVKREVKKKEPAQKEVKKEAKKEEEEEEEEEVKEEEPMDDDKEEEDDDDKDQKPVDMEKARKQRRWTSDTLIAESTSIETWQAKAVMKLLDQECTIPFIARYRKAQTGNLEPEKLRDIQESYENLKQLNKKVENVIKTLAKEKKASGILISALINAKSLTEVELLRCYHHQTIVLFLKMVTTLLLTRSELTRQATKESVDVFCTNLRSLLLTPPVRGKVVLGIDPGFKHGCKLAVVDLTCKYAAHIPYWLFLRILHEFHEFMLLELFYDEQRPLPKVLFSASNASQNVFWSCRCDTIALGNGTACRETETFLTNLITRKYFFPLEQVKYW